MNMIIRLGTIIVIPVLFFVPLGLFIDRVYASLPFGVIGAFAISACISSIWVIRMIQNP